MDEFVGLHWATQSILLGCLAPVVATGTILIAWVIRVLWRDVQELRKHGWRGEG